MSRKRKKIVKWMSTYAIEFFEADVNLYGNHFQKQKMYTKPNWTKKHKNIMIQE